MTSDSEFQQGLEEKFGKPFYVGTYPSRWILCSERLPRDGQLVLIYTPDTVAYGYGNVPRNRHVAQFVQGKVVGSGEPFTRYDVAPIGNNRVPYGWSGDGPMHWNGQDVTHWMPLPDPPTMEARS